jgi:hypothetical protein
MAKAETGVRLSTAAIANIRIPVSREDEVESPALISNHCDNH